MLVNQVWKCSIKNKIYLFDLKNLHFGLFLHLQSSLMLANLVIVAQCIGNGNFIYTELDFLSPFKKGGGRGGGTARQH